MPQFVSSLKRLEVSRSNARDTLVVAIWQAAEKNRRGSRKNIMQVLAGGVIIVGITFSMAIWLRRHLLLPITALAATTGSLRSRSAGRRMTACG